MLGAVGCETMNAWDAIAFGLGTSARDENKTEKQREAASYLEQIAKEQAEREHERDIANRGRDEVNVYVEREKDKQRERLPENVIYSDGKYEPAPGYEWINPEKNSDLSVRKKIQEKEEKNRYFFTCNYWKDFDQDGFWDYPDEYVGIKNKFRDDEKILLVSRIQDKKGQLFKKEIYNPSGELIRKDESIVESNRGVKTTGYNWDLMNWLVENGGYGSYKAVWYLDYKSTSSSEFEIVHSEK